MADFEQAFSHVLDREGGYRGTNVKGDRGGHTFAGISRRSNPDWEGWNLIDVGVSHRDPRLRRMILARYRIYYWERVQADEIHDQVLSTLVFSCAVLSGVGTASRFLQLACGATVDGLVGRRTIEKVNETSPETVILRMTLARIARYHGICQKRKSQRKFFFGWVDRALDERLADEEGDDA